MFRLGDLLWIDDQYENGISVPDCFGDRFLCRRNSLFRAIRIAFLETGGLLKDASGFDEGRRYLAAPLLCLDNILRSGIVPFVGTTSAVREILRANPNLALTPPMLPHLVMANHTLHESCHCVSDRLFASRRTEEPFRRLIQALCTEAFANSIERLAMADLSSPTDGLFFALNSYVPIITGPTVASLKTAVSQFGLSAVLSMAMLCYFCINIFPSPPPPPMILEFLCEGGFEIGDDANHWIEHLSKDIFIIKSTFRDDTSLIWFSLIGLDKEFTALGRRELTSGFLRDLEIRSSIELHVKHLEATIARGNIAVNSAAAG